MSSSKLVVFTSLSGEEKFRAHLPNKWVGFDWIERIYFGIEKTELYFKFLCDIEEDFSISDEFILDYFGKSDDILYLTVVTTPYHATALVDNKIKN